MKAVVIAASSLVAQAIWIGLSYQTTIEISQSMSGAAFTNLVFTTGTILYLIGAGLICYLTNTKISKVCAEIWRPSR